MQNKRKNIKQIFRTSKGHPAKLPDAPFDSCFYILNGNLNPTPEDYCAAFLIDADVIDQTAPQFFPELRLFSRQIFQFGDEVREYLLRVILLLDESFQFLKAAMLFAIEGTELLFFLRLLRLIQGYTRILPDEVRNCHMTILPNGDLYACRRLESKVGNILTDRLANVWTGPMEQYRNYNEFQKCSKCELLPYCRGCPAVAYGATCSFYGSDPQCWKAVIST